MLPYLLCFQIFQIFYAKPNRVISFFVVLVVGEIQIAEPPTVMQSAVYVSHVRRMTPNVLICASDTLVGHRARARARWCGLEDRPKSGAWLLDRGGSMGPIPGSSSQRFQLGCYPKPKVFR